MRRYILLLSLLTGWIILFSSCQKEYSLELSGTRSSGSLQSDGTGECLPKTVEGVYEAGTALDGTENYIDVQINVASVGTYRVYSDTVNGMYFEAKGSFATTGLNNVRLLGNGTPLNAGMQSFIITYDTTECAVAVTTLPQGGAGPAEFTLMGSPNTCLDFNVAGTYIVGAALTPANTVVIKVNVTKTGTYTITTGETNGMTFSGSGALTALGERTITLVGTGTPAVASSTNVSVPHGATNCGFTVNVVTGAVFTIDCTSPITAGTYEEGVALGANNTVQLTIDVTTAGPYSITATGGGMTFTAAGTFAMPGAGQTVNLVGSGTPIADGDVAVQIPNACSFNVTVDPATAPAGGTFKFTSGATTYEGDTFDAEIATDNNITYLMVTGATNTGGYLIGLSMGVDGGAAITTGQYSGTALTGKIAGFTFTDGTVVWIAGAGTGASVNINLTVYNTTTGVVEGTFSGTAIDLASGTTHTITNGTFKATLP